MQPQKPLVLVADDERNAVLLLTRILERDGFAVESARDGVTALEKARTMHPDLILMDVQMPRMNGFEVTAELREDDATARIPVIFVTAAAREPSDVAHGFQLGADDYIRKPYNYHELLARAHSKMQARQLEDRLQRRSEELEALVRIGGEFNQRLSLDDLTELILAATCQEMNAANALLVLFDEDQKLIIYRDAVRGVCPLEEADAMLSRDDTLFGTVLRLREPLLVSGPGADGTLPACMRNFEMFSAIATPLKHDNRLTGILAVLHPQPGFFGESALRMVRSIGEQAALAVRNAQLHSALQSYAQNLESMVEQRTRELKTAQAQLMRNEKLAALGRLAASIAHEVNNPLQPILNCLEVAIEDINTGELVDVEVLRVAENEVQRIKEIVARLLDFARPSPSDASPVNFHQLVHEVLTLANKQLERMRIETQVNLANVPAIEGNPSQLKQVILNLVLNATEAMPDGGQLGISLYQQDDGVALSIADTGVGIDDATLTQIFEPFYSTKGDGTGLGLAVSYGIIQGHSGTINVESKPGAGSRFIVWLPLPEK